MELIPEISKETKVKIQDQKESDKLKVSDSDVDNSDLLNELDKIARQFETEPTQTKAVVQGTKPAHKKLHFEQPKKSEQTLDEIKHNHLKFHITGQSENWPASNAAKLIPVLNVPFLNIDQIRHEFPLLIKNGSESYMQPLKEYFDNLVEGSELNKDKKEHLKQLLLKLELILKKKSYRQTAIDFKSIWNKAVTSFLHSENLNKQKNDPVKDEIKSFHKFINAESELFPLIKGPNSHFSKPPG